MWGLRKRYSRVVTRNRDRSLDATGQPKVYQPVDPSLRTYDHRLGSLILDGSAVGHIASVVGEMRFPARQPWVWFIVVWLDGSREFPFEDYGPGWYTIRELDAGYLAYHLPSKMTEKRFFGRRLVSGTPGTSREFKVEWLPADKAASQWEELGLVDEDF